MYRKSELLYSLYTLKTCIQNRNNRPLPFISRTKSDPNIQGDPNKSL